MYLVCEKDNSECPSLLHGIDVFKRARQSKAARIHVLMPGEEGYDLVHIKNADCRPDFIKNRWKNQSCYPEYDEYSIEEKSGLYLLFFRIFTTVVIRSVNEYTVALAQVILRYTKLSLFTTDSRMQWFFKEEIPCIEESKVRPEKDVLIIGDVSDDDVFDVSFHSIGPVNAFHNVFFLQGQGAFDPERVRFAELVIDEGAGIGSVLNNLYRFREALSKIGLTPVVRKGKIGHFSVAFLESHFNLRLQNSEANDDNTIFFPEMSTLAATMFLDWVKPEMSLSILGDKFHSDMKEYADTIIGNRRILGVLIRGTDYLIVHKDGPRKMATVDDMIPVIHEWIDSFGYEGIFLATEDIDILNRMRDEFGTNVCVIAQERHSVSDLAGHMLLSELEEKRASDYERSVAESTVNYFYALYMLSRCSAFICSGPCNGYDLATGFNEGRYERVQLFKNL